MTTGVQGALAPVAEVLTVAAAIEAVSAKIDALVSARVEEFKDDVAKVSASAAFLQPVTTEEQAERIADDRKRSTSVARELDASRLELTRRLDALKARMKGPFDREIAKCKAATDRLTEAVEPYLLEKKRLADEEAARVRRIRDEAEAKAREEQRQKDEEARKARDEADRLERERDEAKTKKARAEADAKLAQARMDADEKAVESEVAQGVVDVVSAPVNLKPQSASVRSVSGASLGIPMVWTHEITDAAKLPAEAWCINEKWIADQYANEPARKLIANKDGHPELPGVRIYQIPRTSSR